MTSKKLTDRAQPPREKFCLHIFSQMTAMAKHGGKTCVAGAPGLISCTNNSYSPGISMHVFSKDESVRSQWVKFVRTYRPDFQPTDYSYLCSLHFNKSWYTRLRLSTLMPTDTIIQVKKAAIILWNQAARGSQKQHVYCYPNTTSYLSDI